MRRSHCISMVKEMTSKATGRSKKIPSLRAQLSLLTVPALKNVLRLNHQNPFGNKPELLTRIVYLATHGGYPSCPKCVQGRLKLRVHRRKDQSKYFCPGYPAGFGEGSSYHQCDYVTDECEKIPFQFPSTLNLVLKK